MHGASLVEPRLPDWPDDSKWEHGFRTVGTRTLQHGSGQRGIVYNIIGTSTVIRLSDCHWLNVAAHKAS
eukprot:2315903-Amphidinium_carterae.1